MIIWRASLEGLRPVFKFDVEQVLRESPHTWYVLSAFRSLQDQEVLYAAFLKGGARAAPPGESAHNFGLAVDVVPDISAIETGLQPDWDTTREEWKWLAKAIDAHPRLHHGRHFTRLRNGRRRPVPDWPHIEAVNWQAIARTPEPTTPV